MRLVNKFDGTSESSLIKIQRCYEFYDNDKFLNNFIWHIFQIMVLLNGGMGMGMNKIVEISGVKYKAKRTADKITLQRYNEKHKMWVNLHFPTDNQADGKKIEEDIIRILSNLYIEKHANAAAQAPIAKQSPVVS